MKQYLLKTLLFAFSLTFFVIVSCDEEEDRPTFPLSGEIFYSSDGTQVAFTALTHSATSWNWDFGDGNTSTEQNPVHVYDEGGYYLATLTATDGSGATVTKEVKLALDLPPYAMLTGDHLADNYDGKTWKMTAAHSAGGDYFANADANFSVVDGTPAPLPTGIFDLEFGMGDIYKDEYTFYFDGQYRHDVKEDDAAFGGIVYQFVLNGGSGIINSNGAEFGLCIAAYTPEDNATFTFTDNENLTIPSVYGPGGEITYENVATLDFSGSEFIGFRDFQQKVIVNKITNDNMQLIMFMAAAQQAIGVNTHALILSFEVVE